MNFPWYWDMGLFLSGLIEEKLEVAPQVREAFAGDLRPVLGLRENERALDHRLRVKREAFGGPFRARRVAPLRLDDVGDEARSVLGDMALAGLADRGMGLVGLLHHRPQETGELGQLALEDRPAEIDVAEEALHRIGQLAVRRAGEDAVSPRGEVPGRGDRELLLAVEMVEEAALGEPGELAHIVDRRCPVTLGADHPQRGVENAGL